MAYLNDQDPIAHSDAGVVCLCRVSVFPGVLRGAAPPTRDPRAARDGISRLERGRAHTHPQAISAQLLLLLLLLLLLQFLQFLQFLRNLCEFCKFCCHEGFLFAASYWDIVSEDRKTMTDNAPNQTLYVRNLSEKTKLEGIYSFFLYEGPPFPFPLSPLFPLFERKRRQDL